MERKDQELAHVRGRNLTATIDEQTLLLMPKVFKTGSMGWHGQGKVTIDDTRCQLSVVVTVIGSKPEGNGPTEGDIRSALDFGRTVDQHLSTGQGTPERPPDESPLFGDSKPPKRGRKRS